MLDQLEQSVTLQAEQIDLICMERDRLDIALQALSPLDPSRSKRCCPAVSSHLCCCAVHQRPNGELSTANWRLLQHPTCH